jgi:hypothetical protein
MMRLLVLTVAVGLATAATLSANGAPVRPNLDDQHGSKIVQVAGGCGPGFHRNYAGYCMRNYYRAYRPYYGYNRPYYRPYYYYRAYPHW